MKDTKQQFEHVMTVCRDLFAKKLHDYGAAWRIMRPSSVTDQLFIKANRIRSIEVKGVTLVDEGIRPELIGIVNMPKPTIWMRNVHWSFMINMPSKRLN